MKSSEIFWGNHVHIHGRLWVAFLVTVFVLSVGLFILWKNSGPQSANTTSIVIDDTSLVSPSGVGSSPVTVDNSSHRSSTEIRHDSVNRGGRSDMRTSVKVDGQPVVSTRQRTNSGSATNNSNTVNMNVSIDSSSSSSSSTVDSSTTIDFDSSSESEVHQE